MSDVIVIGVAGGTGSGKTTLVKALMNRFGDNISVLSHDNYYKRHDEMSYEERTHLNYDCPDAFDTDMMIEHLRMLKNGQAIDCPTYDFTVHNRAEGILHGSLIGLLYLEDLDADAEVNVGDVIVTSGLGGSYARGLIIGTVVKVDAQQGDTSRRIVVSPNDSIDTLEDVLVVSSVGASDDDDSDSNSSSSSSASAGGSSSSSSSSNGSNNSGNGDSSNEGGR